MSINNTVLAKVRDIAVQELRSTYGYCGVIEGEDIVIITSADGEGKDIKITITLKDE